HPYTLGLMASQPQLGAEKKRLVPIPGMVPRLTEIPAGCSFRDRCSLAIERCALGDPALRFVADGHGVACVVVDGEG
ncbi:MAG: oligopeptide/dipeptide ABC transporter ATP-binding protein, partial [Candidatus Binatia bacterium]